MKIGTVDTTDYGTATILVQRYPAGGAIAVQLFTEEGEPLSTFSTNLVPYGASVEVDEFTVKAWAENEQFLKPMMDTGLFEDTGKRVTSMHVTAPIWRLKDVNKVPSSIKKEH
jgi:hypothetical protein